MYKCFNSCFIAYGINYINLYYKIQILVLI